jgi:D-beta-D-heptose 7-phosphate kinase/D-beta-D-heptose 1-phosphate adenosyltransferase
VLIGDMMVDEYVYCNVSRISPEAPVLVAEPFLKEMRLGGAANVAKNMLELRCPLHAVVGALGRDHYGTFIAQEFGTIGVWMECGDTVVKQRFISDKKHLLRVDHNDHVKMGYTQTDFAVLQEACRDADIVVISDYGKGTIKPAIYDVAKRFSKPDAKVIIDPYPEHAHWYWGRWLVKANNREHERIRVHMNSKWPEYLKETPFYLRTMGYDGASRNRANAVTGDRENTKFGALKGIEVTDVTGAGDVFLAALVKGIVDGGLLDDAIRVANICAGRSVTKFGTVAVSFQDYVEACGMAR